MRIKTLFIALFLFFSGPSHSFGATLYKCIEPGGKVRYTDTYVSERCQPLIFKHRKTATHNFGSEPIQLRQKAAKFQKYISYYGSRFNVDPLLIRAVIRTESGFNPKAVSKKGAKGLMQLMPETAKELNVKDVFNPKENIMGGTKYLRTLLNTFSNDLKLALAAYNAGPTKVKREKGIPQIQETEDYVKKVLKYYREYKRS